MPRKIAEAKMEMSSMVSRIESAEEGDEDGRLRVSFWEKDFDLRPFVSPGHHPPQDQIEQVNISSRIARLLSSVFAPSHICYLSSPLSLTVHVINNSKIYD